MAWIDKQGKQKQVVKKDGECMNKSQWRYCPFWYARHDVDSKQVITYWCNLYDKEKPGGYASLPECNEDFGLTNMPNL